jgi:hypothetical protein
MMRCIYDILHPTRQELQLAVRDLALLLRERQQLRCLVVTCSYKEELGHVGELSCYILWARVVMFI